MTWGQKAEDVFEVETAGHVTTGTWIKNILNVVTGGSPDGPEFDLNIKRRSSGEIVYSMRLQGGIAAEEGHRGMEDDLKTLSVEEFCRKHDIALPE
jgi:hypothetical protein